MREILEKVLITAKEEIAKAPSLHELLNLKSRYVGKKSELTEFMKQLGKLTPEERPAFGKKINDVKSAIEELLTIAENRIKEDSYQKELLASKLDLTMPGRKQFRGVLHPITQVWREIEDAFISMGFEVAEGFDIDDEFHNFDALNTPKDHPSRNLADTFYIKDDVLLRTQTSTVQIRVMESCKPPIRIISPGRCYRNDKADHSHSPVFHQVEALVVDKNITFADLRDTLNSFVQKMFGNDIQTRFRPHFFPFTEPSAEIDIVCTNCHGKGCPTCKQSGWLEMGGAGMVDPNVFEILGIDPEVYSGFAFGLGISRIVMVKHQVPDLRLLYENDIRFLDQFR